MRGYVNRAVKGLSAANSNKSHYQSDVFVCVSSISGHNHADNCSDAVDRAFNSGGFCCMPFTTVD